MRFSKIIMLILSCWAVFFVSSAIAQTNSHSTIKVLSKSYQDSVVLRWGPSDAETWKNGNENGYIIERYTVTRNNSVIENSISTKVLLTDTPIKPAPIEVWSNFQENDYVAIAAQAIYGENLEISSRDLSVNDLASVINRNKEIETKFSFALLACDMNPKVAQLHGLWLADRNIKSDEKYLYKIYQNSQNSDTAYAFSDPTEYNELAPPRDVTAQFSDHAVMIRWDKFYDQGIYSFYFVERSDDGGLSWSKINSLPYVNTEKSLKSKGRFGYMTDSLPSNEFEYKFRVRGTTPFGEIGPPSLVVAGKGIKPNLVCRPLNFKGKVNKQNNEITLNWEPPTNNNELILGYSIFHSSKSDSVFEQLNDSVIPKDQFSYIDINPDGTNYYEVRSILYDGRTDGTFPILIQLSDNIAPEKPNGLNANVSKSGRLVLNWNKNSEKDLLGYRVYRANNRKEEFSQYTYRPIGDTFFVDTIQLDLINKHVYYKVMALDKHYNSSDFSDVYEVERPDILPPKTPVILTYNVGDTCLSFEISQSSKDVEYYTILRKGDQGKWQDIARINSLDFIDSNLKQQTLYNYKIIAVDSAGLESSNPKVYSFTTLKSRNTKIDWSVDGIVNRNEKMIQLTFNYKHKPVDKVLLYRSDGDNPLRLYKTIPSGQLTYTDTKLFINSVYNYSIRLLYMDGNRSQSSQKIQLKY